MDNINFKKKPLDQRRKQVRLIIGRILKSYELKEVKELATVFNCTYGAIKNWGSSGKVPLDPLFQCHFETGSSLDWLVHGTDPIVVFNRQRANDLTGHMSAELSSGARYKLIEEKCEGGIEMLAAGLSESLLNWMKIKIIEHSDQPVKLMDK